MQKNEGTKEQQSNKQCTPANIFLVPKDVLCPKHNEKIQWLDLNQQSDQRFFCSKCFRPQNDKILSYNYVFSRVLQQAYKPTQLYRCQEEFVKVKKILFEQIDLIQQELQALFNFYQNGITPYVYSNLYDKQEYLTIENLYQLALDLSKKIHFQNGRCNFIPELTETDEKKLNKIERGIQCLQKCSEQINRYYSQPNEYKFMRFPELDHEKVNIVKYEKQNELQIPLKVTAITMNEFANVIAIACINKQPEIQIWDIGNIKHMFNQVHQSEINILSWEKNFISVDLEGYVVFWQLNPAAKFWKAGRVYHTQMQSVTCIQFDFYFHYLALGGSNLQLWILNNTMEYKVINLTNTQISCLRQQNEKMLVSADVNGKIQIFQALKEDWESWEQVDEIQLPQKQLIRSITFRNRSNDFVCFQLGNNLFKCRQTDFGYEYEMLSIDQMDESLIYDGFIINPKVNDQAIETQISQLRGIFHLVTYGNNRMVIYVST